MKIVFVSLLVLALVSCGNGSVKKNNDDSGKNAPDKEISSVDESDAEDSAEELTPEPRKLLPSDGKLKCKILPEAEFGIPQSEVYVSFDSKLKKVGKCLTCETITPASYRTYDIPKEALSACGGWFAGGGDYFYSIVNEKGNIEVYAGWQDEGQMEDNDTGFHWELKLEVINE